MSTKCQIKWKSSPKKINFLAHPLICSSTILLLGTISIWNLWFSQRRSVLSICHTLEIQTRLRTTILTCITLNLFNKQNKESLNKYWKLLAKFSSSTHIIANSLTFAKATVKNRVILRSCTIWSACCAKVWIAYTRSRATISIDWTLQVIMMKLIRTLWESMSIMMTQVKAKLFDLEVILRFLFWSKLFCSSRFTRFLRES